MSKLDVKSCSLVNQFWDPLGTALGPFAPALGPCGPALGPPAAALGPPVSASNGATLWEPLRF